MVEHPATSESSPARKDLPAASAVTEPNRKHFGLKGITPRLAVVMTLVALVPLLLVGRSQIQRALTAMELSTQELQLAVVADVSRTTRSELDQARLELASLGEILLGPGGATDEERIEFTKARLLQSGRLDWLSVYSRDGSKVATLAVKGTQKPNASERLAEEFRARLDTSPLVIDEVFGLAYPVGRLTLKVEFNGVTRGYISAGVSLLGVCNVLKEIASRRFEDIPESVYLIDNQRRLVAHPNAELAASREERADRGFLPRIVGERPFNQVFGLTPEFTAPDGERRLGAIESLPELGWAVVVELPTEVAYAGARRMQRDMLIFGGLAALLAAGLAVLLSRFVTRPVVLLVSATEEVARGAFDTRVPVERDDELGFLGQKFNFMAVSLQEKIEQLRHEELVRSNLSRYLPSEVVEEVIQNPGRLKLGGERREVTVMFADIVSFTSLSENLEPEVMVAVLNELFTIATEIVLRRGGIIDKFIGDCTMAVFGTPTAHEDDALRAILAAEDLLRWLEVGNRRWRKAYNLQLSMAIGINTGPAVAGNIGSQKRMEYTVIGDTVNVAARLESLAKPGQILISQSTLQAAGKNDVDVSPAGLHNLGRSGSTMVFAIDVG